MAKRYTYNVKITKEEGGFLAVVPALQGCQTWGKTYEEAVVNAEEAIQGYLEWLRKEGKPVPVESRHFTSLHLTVPEPA
ncbi:MAG: type II toxin-antitoxin system HicB family antitoxin [Verrucomicrobia bacterium]|nr:type II toxin-antitoxin system HicB family antitoxin [Verrucomicrobiota bacterium]